MIHTPGQSSSSSSSSAIAPPDRVVVVVVVVVVVIAAPPDRKNPQVCGQFGCLGARQSYVRRLVRKASFIAQNLDRIKARSTKCGGNY